MKIMQIQGLVGGGGSEVHTSILSRGLRARGHEVVVCLPRGSDALADELGAAGCEVELFPLVPTPLRLVDLPGVRWTAERARRYRVDVIHSHIWNADVLALFAGRWLGVPIVSTLHGPTISIAISKNVLHRLHHRIYARMLARFDRIIAISAFVRRYVAADLRIPEERIDVVHNCSEVERYRKPVDRPAVRRRLGVPEGAVVVVIVGELSPRKGILDFVEAAGRVAREAPEAHFLVIGRGPQEVQVRERASALGLTGRIHLLGQRSDIPELLGASDVMAVTSYQEGFGRTITEAMSAELPVVSYDSGATPEIVLDGATGFLTPEGDPAAFAEGLLALVRSAELRLRFGHAGLERATRHFDVGPFLGATEAILAQAVRGEPPAAATMH